MGPESDLGFLSEALGRTEQEHPSYCIWSSCKGPNSPTTRPHTLYSSSERKAWNCFPREAHGAFCPVLQTLPASSTETSPSKARNRDLVSLPCFLLHNPTRFLPQHHLAARTAFTVHLSASTVHPSTTSQDGGGRPSFCSRHVQPLGKTEAYRHRNEGVKSVLGLGHCQLWPFPQATSSLLTEHQATHTKMMLGHREGLETKQGARK